MDGYRSPTFQIAAVAILALWAAAAHPLREQRGSRSKPSISQSLPKVAPEHSGLFDPATYSHLSPHPSALASLSYLYQGFPENVMGLSFTYADPVGLRHERYLSRLLANASEEPRPLLAAATFLANRLYVDKANKPHLAIGLYDARNYWCLLRYQEDGLRDQEDLLLRQALMTYLELRIDRSEALADFSSSKLRDDRVFRNVREVASQISTSNEIDDSWESPFPVR